MNEQLLPESEQTLQTQLILLKTAAQITKTLCSILELDLLLKTAVELIRDHFVYYHIHLYLLDDSREWVIIRASTGITGRILVEKEYKVEINNSTLIGNCVLYRNIYMVTNENVGRFKFRNSLLPEANSVIAIPLVNQDEVLGVLEIQDVRKDGDVTFAIESFSFQIIADHIAVAIYNAQQFAQKGTK